MLLKIKKIIPFLLSAENEAFCLFPWTNQHPVIAESDIIPHKGHF
jgi:hypothetical protein